MSLIPYLMMIMMQVHQTFLVFSKVESVSIPPSIDRVERAKEEEKEKVTEQQDGFRRNKKRKKKTGGGGGRRSH